MAFRDLGLFTSITFGIEPHVCGTLQHFREIVLIMTTMMMIFMVVDSRLGKARVQQMVPCVVGLGLGVLIHDSLL